MHKLGICLKVENKDFFCMIAHLYYIGLCMSPLFQSQRNQTITSDQLHNLNCYRYLEQVRVSSSLCDAIPELKQIHRIQQKQCYQKEYAYGNLYTSLMETLDNRLDAGGLAGSEWDDFFISLYKNNNHNLEETYRHMQKFVIDKSPSSPIIQNLLSQEIRDQGSPLNAYTPASASSGFNLITTMIHPYFKPTHFTNLATERHYRHTRNVVSQELRIGTQGQFHAYVSRVDPLFKRFLQAQENRLSVASSITHLYFNNLAWDTNSILYERRFETSLTLSLYQLEKNHANIAVITLPADKGLMSPHESAHLAARYDCIATRQLFLDIALESDSVQHATTDFHISPKVRQLVFGSKIHERAVLSQLVDNSFKTMGLSANETLSAAERQAVLVHFLKYELPHWIITALKPDTYNFSCKDGIDRAGISSAYYNLLSSFAKGQAMTRHEFEQALHAAPLMVKGRGMNDHLKTIWNALDQYIAAHSLEMEAENKQWLLEWRDANCPAERSGELLERRLQECIKDIESHRDSSLSRPALEILKSIQLCDRSYAKNHALYLDVVVSTHKFYKHPQQINNEKGLIHYDHLIKKMLHCDEKPVSLMEHFLRILRYLFCLRQPKPVHTKERTRLVSQMSLWRSMPQTRLEVFEPEFINDLSQQLGK